MSFRIQSGDVEPDRLPHTEACGQVAQLRFRVNAFHGCEYAIVGEQRRTPGHELPQLRKRSGNDHRKSRLPRPVLYTKTVNTHISKPERTCCLTCKAAFLVVTVEQVDLALRLRNGDRDSGQPRTAAHIEQRPCW